MPSRHSPARATAKQQTRAWEERSQGGGPSTATTPKDTVKPLDPDETTYKVRRITQRRTRHGRHEYRVAWVGYPGQDTWEPRDNLPDHDAELRVIDAQADARERRGKTPLPTTDATRPNITASSDHDNASTSHTGTIKPANHEPPIPDDPAECTGAEPDRPDQRDPNSLTDRERTNLVTHIAWGHRSHSALVHMVRLGLIPKDTYYADSALPFCVSCAIGSMRRSADRSRLHHNPPRAICPGDLIVVDVVPSVTVNVGGFRSALICVDSSTRHITATLLHDADDLLPALKALATWWRNRRHPIQRIKSDQGGDLTSGAVKRWMAESGIEPMETTSYDHHQAGAAEKAVDLCKATARAWVQGAGLDYDLYFLHALAHAARVHTRSPRRVIEWRVPYTLATGRTFDLRSLAPFGCDAYKHIDKDARKSKGDPRAM